MLRPVRKPKVKMGVRELPQVRFPGHKAWVKRNYECLLKEVDGARCFGPVEFCHFRLGSHTGKDQTPPDYLGWPGCSAHHRHIQHVIGEATFQKRYGVDLRAVCLTLAKASIAARNDRGMRDAMSDAGVW